jgi:hypothetical protein
MSAIWVQSIDQSGQGYDLTDRIEGLGYSNTRPGGDETANFTYMRPWKTNLPEIAKGNILRIGYALDVLWQGRIEEADRGGGSSETIAVTAYGLGARLKDNTVSEIYVDGDLGNWQGISSTRRKALLAATYTVLGFSIEPDTATGLQALAMDGSGRWTNFSVGEAIYDAGPDALLASVKFDWTAENHASGGLTAATWIGWVVGADDDALTNSALGTDALTGGTSGTLTETTAVSGKRVAAIDFTYPGASAADPSRTWTLSGMQVKGDHGLSALTNGGYSADQIIRDVVSRVSGVTARRIDGQSYEILQAEYRDPTLSEDVITDVNKYEGNPWGTWGPDSPLDISTNGNFDYTELDLTTQHWFAQREDLESLDLHSEMATLFDTVKVSYTDPGGASRMVTRTATVPDLIDAGMSPKTIKLDAGTLTPAAAAALGDTFLVLTGGFAPARGSATIAQPIRHYQRGDLPPCYLRADGSNIRIPDILPTNTLFELSAAPDRRTTFPIKRVNVDASGPQIMASIELDQANDLLSVLQSRLDLGVSVLT